MVVMREKRKAGGERVFVNLSISWYLVFHPFHTETTLAREVYDHPLTSHTFEIRAWVNVSQDYDKTMKRNLLIRILEVASQKKRGDYEKSSEDTLGEDTLKCLKGKKYLIVMDDIWGIKAWNDIQRSLPKECNGIFGKKCCPLELVGISEHIAEKCEGLPLAIVAIAGILTVEEKTLDMWEEVSRHLSSIIAKNQNGCMEILELSYNHLPLHLKACFVYIGGFPEDYEILVRKLIWLWIAEGFIQQREGDKSLEDIAKDYLSSLIDRSLVMVARKRSFGELKVCRIHDLLRELCLKKAEENDFLVRIYEDDTFSPSAASKRRRLFISSQIFCESFLRPFSRNLRSLLCLCLQNSSSVFRKNLSFFVEDEDFKLLTLRVLCFPSAAFHGKIERMHHLRYLAFQVPADTWDCLSPFTSCLLNLETLTFQSDSLFEKTIPLPLDIFKMVKLRHLYAKKGCRNFLVRTLNLKKLGFYGELISNDLVLMLPDLEFLKCLEKLSFNNCRNWIEATSVPPVTKFPPTITHLTLKNIRLNWKELSILQTLPSLEVLKLSDGACKGQIWNTSELEGFSQLKYLRLQDLDIREWNASEDQFPRLEVLVVKQCFYLERIPIDFANLNELREIEVKWSSRTTEESAREIQEEQRNTRGDEIA
ncbi:putative late blight resistance protein homolog R1B-17 [Rhododendron vialii]|uniref:putative late blight resistance protein homolog R1B-17 n=1 Tax=Rhododendron vialii TaxID=182163 RepID=UPI00265E2A50|nr:putative late blight resistance protein homolog R1B-17 [Rhododendron vialii]